MGLGTGIENVTQCIRQAPFATLNRPPPLDSSVGLETKEKYSVTSVQTEQIFYQQAT